MVARSSATAAARTIPTPYITPSTRTRLRTVSREFRSMVGGIEASCGNVEPRRCLLFVVCCLLLVGSAKSFDEQQTTNDQQQTNHNSFGNRHLAFANLKASRTVYAI